ncbi:putative F-box/LRR-repeat protein 22 [Brachypodium distachyon]|uniref:putative F-box/LRR-repeat protein 22 n=1 Tax=Brachypodium distachyon TaxID=15368 RepID=UPI00052FDFCD|nr:putative F-box/LRR-repeat protein 22 [Brachypodium distachyon]|eukprot:XP_010238902.1 putative F-box/LRR-repeat protein 22 [Brachypodium distachyon]
METDWSGLPLDLLAAIFANLSVCNVLSGAGLVCHSWLDAAKLPTLWRSVDMAPVPIGRCYEEDLCSMALVAVDRAAGRLEAFAGAIFVSDALLRCIAERCEQLRKLPIQDIQIRRVKWIVGP